MTGNGHAAKTVYTIYYRVSTGSTWSGYQEHTCSKKDREREGRNFQSKENRDGLRSLERRSFGNSLQDIT